MIMTSLTDIVNYLIIQLYDICNLSDGFNYFYMTFAACPMVELFTLYAISGMSDVLNHLIIH